MLTVNGIEHRLSGLDGHTTLLDALRDYLQLTGSKKGCAPGVCDACTVLVDGRRVSSCLTLAAMNRGKAITAVDGLAKDGRLHPLQAAFIAHDGFPMRLLHAGADHQRHRLHRRGSRAL